MAAEMAAAAILKIREMPITLDWIQISTPKFMGRCTRPCGDDQLTKSQNRKLICETSLNECLEHKCVDLSDYRIYLNQILYRAQAPHY